MKILQNCWTVNEKRLGVCCRLNNEDYLDYDEEQIQIDYDNEHEKSDSKTVIPAMLPSQSITSHGKKDPIKRTLSDDYAFRWTPQPYGPSKNY